MSLLFLLMGCSTWLSGQNAMGRNDSLTARLDTIFQDDQDPRKKLKSLEATHGPETEEWQLQWALIQKKDSINLLKVREILDTHGWLGPDAVGAQGNATLFLIIQHAPLEVQEAYLPMMRSAVQKGNASPGNLALLEDRVAVRNGRRQLYGSQIGRDPSTGEYYVFPLADPDHVDARRKEVGLGSLQDYISSWGLVWDVEAYKKALPELEAKIKE